MRPTVNYLYFGFFFALLVFLSTCSVFIKDNLVGSRIFFLFYSVGQALLETLLFIFFAELIRRAVGKIAFYLFIGFTFLCYIVHVVDFLLDRILDSSTIATLSFVLDETFENFFNLLKASGLPLYLWVILFTLVAMLPFVGMALYKMTHWVSEKKPLTIPKETFLQLFVCIPTALFLWDYSGSKVIDPDAYTAFIQSLPWKQTFIRPKSVQFETGPLQPHQTEEEILQSIEQVSAINRPSPSIFLFVAESLRADYITAEIAPNLAQFRDANIRADLSLSNANGTQVSWFSLFHSQFPFYWSQYHKEGWTSGSPALALFKKLGYQIRVYSSADLAYYGMDQLIFGKNLHLADSFQLFDHMPPKQVCDADRSAVNALKNDLQTNPDLQKGNLCIVFLDSTHFDYSWPKKSASKFTPFGSEISYFYAYQSKKSIELIKNRYRNAVHYIDALFAEFLGAAPADALIAFTGDHGEEFFEHGHLFHNSHLIHEQTHIPIYLKIGANNHCLPLLTQMDVMPTLLEAVAGRQFPILQGESALREKQWPFVAIARFNASRSPYEFCLHNGKNKFIAQFTNRTNIFKSDALHIRSLRTYLDQSLPEFKKNLAPWIEREFGPALGRLFSEKPN